MFIHPSHSHFVSLKNVVQEYFLNNIQLLIFEILKRQLLLRYLFRIIFLLVFWFYRNFLEFSKLFYVFLFIYRKRNHCIRNSHFFILSVHRRFAVIFTFTNYYYFEIKQYTVDSIIAINKYRYSVRIERN